jgi:hypothetical protein
MFRQNFSTEFLKIYNCELTPFYQIDPELEIIDTGKDLGAAAEVLFQVPHIVYENSKMELPTSCSFFHFLFDPPAPKLDAVSPDSVFRV